MKQKKWIGLLGFMLLLLLSLTMTQQVFAEALPSKLDPRLSDQVTKVKQQDRNICWSFAAMAAVEQNYVKNTGIKMDLSENYYNYLLAANITGTYDWSLGVNGSLDSGFSYEPVLDKLMVWEGPVLETTFPNSIKGFQDVSILNNRPTALHVQGYTVLPKMDNYKTNTASEITARVNEIKTNIQKYGNVLMGRDGLGSYRGDNYTQNLLPDRVVAPNHDVTIVGWDDSIDRTKFLYQPARNGAFIVKNSWGENWGDGGYYYLSYEDAFLRSENLHSVTAVESINNYKKRYGFARGTYGGQDNTTSNKIVAHVFDAPTEAEKIEAVSLTTKNANVSYEIYVNPNGGVTNGLDGFTKVKEGTKEDIGAATIRLNQAIPITSKGKFSVAIKYIKPDGLQRLDIPTDTGIVGGNNTFVGYSLDSSNRWYGGSKNYLFNVYTSSNEPINYGKIKEVFPDGVLASHIATQLGKTVDDSFTDTDSKKIKYISLSGYNGKVVKNAEGIQYLPNLNNLTIQKGELTSIDLSQNKELTFVQLDGNQLANLDLSQNTKLTWIEVSTNKLETLNVKKCAALETLQASQNKLTSLDVSGSPNLDWLGLYWNNISSIDVTTNKKLRTLIMDMNNLSELDVRQNPLLRSLNFYNNRLTSIDVTKNTELFEIRCSYNQLSHLDVSKNVKLDRIQADNNKIGVVSELKYNPALTFVNLINNQLKEIDVSQNAKLAYLHIANNQLSGKLNLMNHPALKYISMQSNQFTGVDVESCINLIDLNASNNQLTSLNVTKNLALKNLNLVNNQVTNLNLSKNKYLTPGNYLTSGNPGIVIIPPIN